MSLPASIVAVRVAVPLCSEPLFSDLIEDVPRRNGRVEDGLPRVDTLWGMQGIRTADRDMSPLAVMVRSKLPSWSIRSMVTPKTSLILELKTPSPDLSHVEILYNQGRLVYSLQYYVGNNHMIQ